MGPFVPPIYTYIVSCSMYAFTTFVKMESLAVDQSLSSSISLISRFYETKFNESSNNQSIILAIDIPSAHDTVLLVKNQRTTTKNK